MPLFKSYDSSELGALLKKEGAEAFDQVLHANELLPEGEVYICSSERGGASTLKKKEALTTYHLPPLTRLEPPLPRYVWQYSWRKREK